VVSGGSRHKYLLRDFASRAGVRRRVYVLLSPAVLKMGCPHFRAFLPSKYVYSLRKGGKLIRYGPNSFFLDAKDFLTFSGIA